MQQPILLKQRLLASVYGPFVPALRQGYLDRILVPRWYVDPGLGTGLNNGTSWANAFNNVATAWNDAITASSAGDDFYVNAASICTFAGAQALAFKGTSAAPNRIFSCTGITNNPPQLADVGPGAQFNTTGTSNIFITGYFYCYGCYFNCGTGTSAVQLNIMNSTTSQMTFDSCQLNITSTGNSSSSIVISGGNQIGSKVTLINTTTKWLGNSIQSMLLNECMLEWRDTPSAIAAGSSGMSHFMQFQRPVVVLMSNVDFIGGVGITTGNTLIDPVIGGIIQMVDCKVNSGVLIGRPGSGSVVDQIVTDSGATNYKQQRDTEYGTLTASTSIYNNASDGTTPISWQVITTGNAKPQCPFECFGIVRKVPAGTYAASKVFITCATPLLKTNDVWVDVQYLGANYALGSPATSYGAGSGSATAIQLPQGTIPATLVAASPGWAVGSLGYDYQLTIPSFTTAIAGEVLFVVKVGKPSFTVNVDPNPTVA